MLGFIIEIKSITDVPNRMDRLENKTVWLGTTEFVRLYRSVM